jgi:hypothetical protein
VGVDIEDEDSPEGYMLRDAEKMFKRFTESCFLLQIVLLKLFYCDSMRLWCIRELISPVSLRCKKPDWLQKKLLTYCGLHSHAPPAGGVFNTLEDSQTGAVKQKCKQS